MKKILFGSTWACVLSATVALYILPVPFQPTLLLICGVFYGRLLGRWV